MNRLLLVEDDDAITLMLKSFFRRFKPDDPAAAELHTVPGVTEALALLKAERFDVLLADKNLLDGDGLQVAAAMRQLHPTATVVLMSAFSEDRALETSDVDGLLAKPFKSLGEVRRVLLEAQGKRAQQLAAPAVAPEQLRTTTA